MNASTEAYQRLMEAQRRVSDEEILQMQMQEKREAVTTRIKRRTRRNAQA